MRNHNNVLTAINLAVKEAGQAILFTSVVLAIGYLAFLICVNKGFAYFGFLSSVAMLTALLADLVLLPALLSRNKNA
jgi:predicted RND superfamily exporter protein